MNSDPSIQYLTTFRISLLLNTTEA